MVADYLLDLQQGLTRVIAATTNANTSRYLHDPRGIFAHEDNAGAWDYTLADGLGSVRAEVSSAGAMVAEGHYDPFGQPFATNGSFDAGFGFTGEQIDNNDLLYLRARYYDPALGIFPSLDPFEGTMQRPMSLNGYSWVEGNPIMNVDPSGMTCDMIERIIGYQSLSDYHTTFISPQNLRDSTPESRRALTMHIAMAWSSCRRSNNNDMWDVEQRLRFLINGYIMDSSFESGSALRHICPEAYAFDPCSGNSLETTIHRNIVRSCLPARLQYGQQFTSLEYLFTGRNFDLLTCLQNCDDTVRGLDPWLVDCQRECFAIQDDIRGCTSLGLWLDTDEISNDVETWGIIYGVSGYFGIGGGIFIMNVRDREGNHARFLVPEFGIGLGGDAGSGLVFVSSSSIEELEGAGGGLSAGVFVTNSVGISNGCQNSRGGGISSGAGISLTINHAIRID